VPASVTIFDIPLLIFICPSFSITHTHTHTHTLSLLRSLLSAYSLLVLIWSNWSPSWSPCQVKLVFSWLTSWTPDLTSWQMLKYSTCKTHTLTLWWYVGVSEVVTLLWGVIGYCCPTLGPPQDTKGSIQAPKRATTHRSSVKVAICEWTWERYEGTEWKRRREKLLCLNMPEHVPHTSFYPLAANHKWVGTQ